MSLRLFYITVSLLLIASCSREINDSSLVKRGGLVFEINSTNGFSGIAVSADRFGKTEKKTEYKDGYRHGLDKKFSVEDERSILIEQTFFKNGDRHGLYFSYHSNGQLSSTGSFKSNYKIGEWKTYYSNGEIASVGNFATDGELSGLYITYHLGGSLATVSSYQKGRLIGKIEKYYSSGQIKERRRYKPGVEVGKFGGYAASAMLDNRSCEWALFKIQTPAEAADERISRRIGQLDGLFETFYPNKKRKVVGNYRAGIAHGDWKYYGEDGRLMIKAQCAMGSKSGLHEEYYPDGSLKYKINYELTSQFGGLQADGEIASIGEGSFYYPSGKLRFISDHIGTLGKETIHGPGTAFLENGAIKTVTNCDDNFCNSTNFSYFDDGNVEAIHTYKLSKDEYYIHSSGGLLDRGYPGDRIPSNFRKKYGEMSILWELEGQATYYYPKGTKYIKIIREMKFGLNGRSTPSELEVRVTDKQIKGKGTYIQGKMHGEWELFEPDGISRKSSDVLGGWRFFR